MTCVVKQDILGLEIPIYNVESVQMFESAQQLRGVEAASSFVELALGLKVVE